MKTRSSSSLFLLAGPTILGLAGIAPTPANAVLSTGLTAYWSLDNTLNDQSVSFPLASSTVADNGTFTGTAAFNASGFFGQAYRGNGASTGHAVFPLSADLSGVPTGSVTVSIWFKASGALPSYAAMAAVSESNAWRVARRGGDTNLTYGYAGGLGDIWSVSTFGVAGTPVQSWNHLVAVTEKNVGTKLYINGVLETSNNNVPNLTTNGSTQFWIGGNPGAAGRDWNGFLDDLGIWNRPLTQTEITQIYNEGRNNAKSLGTLLAVENLDTDGDGLVDAWEQANLPAGAYLDNGSVNPAYGANGDPDNDSSTNLQEFQRKTNPMVFDTDGDGIRDGYETNTGTYVSATNTGTDPLNPDGDGDGLLDGAETNTGTFVNAGNTGSSPFLTDTDSDTFPDGTEVANGSNPNSNGSVPVIPGLPIADNFDDGLFDTARWTRVTTPIPQAGASIVESGGHIRITGRAHLNTRSQFDPEDPAVGGIYITGKWTFRSIEDFIQIITRSSGTPAGGFGETSGGLEFYVEETSNNPTIRKRDGGPDIQVDTLTQAGKITLEKDKTYDFTIIDTGLAKGGFISFRISEPGNPGNSVAVSGHVTSIPATAIPNYVTFHNREGGDKVADLDDVTIGKMTDTDSDGIPDFWETANGLNPAVANGGDTDNDGSTDLNEYLVGTKPTVADTDGDGLNDGAETDTGFYADATDAGTDPLLQDTDGDLLKDGVETGTLTYVSPTNTGTYPTVVDSDGDFIGDGVEVAVGMNPSDPDDTGLAKGLVSYWSFNNTLADLAHGSGFGQSGTADNASFTVAPDVGFDAGGLFGSAILLNGGAGYVTVPKSPDTIGGLVTKSVTISLWVKANAFDTEWQTIAAQGEGNYWRIARTGNSNPGTIYYNGGDPDMNSSSSFAAPTGWIHIVGVSSGQLGTKLYVNGVQEANGGDPLLDLNLAAAKDMLIGNNPDSPGREFNGYIDDVAMWNRALKPEEITQIYEAGIAPTPTSLGDLIGIVPPTNTYGAWIAGYNVGSQTGFEDDADGDGLENGVENLLGSDPSKPNAGLVQVSTAGSVSTFRHSANPTAASDITPRYQWSTDLATWNNSGVAAGGTTVTFVATPNSPTAGTTSVAATVTGTSSARLFFRLAAVQN